MITKDALAAHAANQKRSFHDRSQTVGASDIGRCERQVWCDKHGAPRRDAARGEDWGAATRGNLIESFWVEALKQKFGERLLFAGDDQRTLRSGFLSATPDALIIDLAKEEADALGIPELEDGAIVAECKSIDPRTRIDGPKPEHAYQVQAQMGLLRETTNYKPAYALLSYIDASSLAVTEFTVKFDPAIYATAKQRAHKIMEAKDIVETMPEGYVAGGRECECCPFVHLCGVARTTVPDSEDAALDPVAITEVANLGREIIRLDAIAAPPPLSASRRKQCATACATSACVG